MFQSSNLQIKNFLIILRHYKNPNVDNNEYLNKNEQI